MGIYYAAPMLGPTLGPLFGGVLVQKMGWHSIFDLRRDCPPCSHFHIQRYVQKGA